MNLISNAIKYSSKTINPQIIIGATQNENETIYFIKDNGVGRVFSSTTKDKKHISKAMGLMEHSLKALSIKNNATFTVDVIDLKDRNGKSCGTEVKIIMPLLFD